MVCTAKQDSGAPLNLTGWAIRSQVRTTSYGPLADLVVTPTDAANGVFELFASAATTRRRDGDADDAPGLRLRHPAGRVALAERHHGLLARRGNDGRALRRESLSGSDREPTGPGLVRRRGWAHLRRRCFASEVAAQTITALIGSATTELFTV